MYRLGRDPNILHEPTLRDMKRSLKLSVEAHIARSYNTFIVKNEQTDELYEVEVEITLRKQK